MLLIWEKDYSVTFVVSRRNAAMKTPVNDFLLLFCLMFIVGSYA
jgi:hypothetical protein